MPLAWSYCVLDGDGTVIDALDADEVHSTASIGKLFLLCEAAERIVAGQLDPDRMITRHPDMDVADSGLWQHLHQASLPIIDVCLLVGAVSDNWATNTLLDVIGLPAVTSRARALGCAHSGLHDRVRDSRLAEHPPTLSSGTARELAGVAWRIHAAAAGAGSVGISQDAATLVEQWLLAGVDLSLVAAPFHLDPLAHMNGPVWLWSKTGVDTEVRADVGVAWTHAHALAYAALASWSPGSALPEHPVDRMQELGRALEARLLSSLG